MEPGIGGGPGTFSFSASASAHHAWKDFADPPWGRGCQSTNELQTISVFVLLLLDNLGTAMLCAPKKLQTKSTCFDVVTLFFDPGDGAARQQKQCKFICLCDP